jgi:hypothetical protein
MQARGPGDALPVVAAGRADHLARHAALLLQHVEVGQPAADLERADRCVVFVLHPAVGAQALAEQVPAVLRGGLESAVDHLGGGLDVLQGG